MFGMNTSSHWPGRKASLLGEEHEKRMDFIVGVSRVIEIILAGILDYAYSIIAKE
jgi:hypothetical protein